MLNQEYEAGVKDHQGRKLSMYEKPGMREVTGKNNSDEVNVARERVNISAREDRVDTDTVALGMVMMMTRRRLQRNTCARNLKGGM